jgi:hypothetical protein
MMREGELIESTARCSGLKNTRKKKVIEEQGVRKGMDVLRWGATKSCRRYLISRYLKVRGCCARDAFRAKFGCLGMRKEHRSGVCALCLIFYSLIPSGLLLRSSIIFSTLRVIKGARSPTCHPNNHHHVTSDQCQSNRSILHLSPHLIQDISMSQRVVDYGTTTLNHNSDS